MSSGPPAPHVRRNCPLPTDIRYVPVLDACASFERMISAAGSPTRARSQRVPCLGVVTARSTNARSSGSISSRTTFMSYAAAAAFTKSRHREPWLSDVAFLTASRVRSTDPLDCDQLTSLIHFGAMSTRRRPHQVLCPQSNTERPMSDYLRADPPRDRSHRRSLRYDDR